MHELIRFLEAIGISAITLVCGFYVGRVYELTSDCTCDLADMDEEEEDDQSPTTVM